MDTPRSTSEGLGKKTRATSCTNCRQVKLKCDLRQRYPNPCSRCTAQNSECKTDASFKRIPARTRIRDLENQIDQLKRDRALEQVTPWPSTEPVPELSHRSPSSTYLDDGVSSQRLSERLSYSPSDPGVSQRDFRWLNITETVFPAHFILGDVSLPYSHALELFVHFENHYFPHFCVIQPVDSLRQLHSDSQLLFWSIATISSHRHSQHGRYFGRLRSMLNTLLGQTITQSIESLLDLQAILLMCAFRCHIIEEPHDPGPGHLAFAIDAARQMGLDKSQDDQILGGWGISLNKHPRYVKQMTWMKCFELDVQMSCWHGLVPSLATLSNLRTVAAFCDNLPTFAEYAAVVSIHAELAASLFTLDEAFGGGSQPPAHIVHLFNERLGALKAKWANSWSLDAQLALLTARLYVYASCFVSSEGVLVQMSSEGFCTDMLQAAQTAAVQLITLQANLNTECVAKLATSDFESNTAPLTLRRRHIRRTVFFAACTLLRYLDAPERISNEERENARNAFTKAYQMFTSTTPEDLSISRTLETVGRIVGQGQRALQPHVTTRKAASIRLNVAWLAKELHKTTPEIGDFTSCPPKTSVMEPVPLEPYLYPASFGDSMWDSTAITLPPHLSLPCNAWDGVAFDNWQGSLPYSLSSGVEIGALYQATSMA